MSTEIPNSKIQNGSDLTGDEVVISGISGLFPMSENVTEFMHNLYNKVDMITVEDLPYEHADAARYGGRISNIQKFDAQFFKVTHKQAESLEPMSRKLMEQAYCAMFDAGINPLTLKGKKVGVYAGSFYSDTAALITSCFTSNPFLISGNCKSMLANRTSYWLDSKGPSYSIVNLAGSLVGLEHAYNSIKNGECDAAIVSGTELTLDTVLSVNLRNAGLICLDGKTRCFDKNGDGTAKAQCIGVVFLQKAKYAKRIYAEVRSCLVEYGLLNKNRNPEETEKEHFLTKFYKNSGLDPNDVEYIEAHGAALPEVDAKELELISEVFGKKKKTIMVGCVKSNKGDSDSANGICAITKLCLAYNTGKLPGNLHYDDPLDVPAIKSGKIKVLTDVTPFNRGLTAINDFSVTGTDCHVILKGHYRPKIPYRYTCTIPRLIFIAGRLDTIVQKNFDKLKSAPLDPEQIALLQEIYQIDTPGFTARGYIIFESTSGDKEPVTLAESIELCQGAPPPLWLLFSGMGSQWSAMGKELLRIPIFSAAIEKCRKILEPKGVDIVKILSDPDKTIFDNIMNCFVGIAAVQIGLIDILKAIGVVPDNIIGHSVGELGCAYFDNCFTADEMILAAYARGLVSIKTKLIHGSMAAVGLGYNKMLALCPPDIDIACHNSEEFCTISGPKDSIDTFVTDLKAKGIFAKFVPTGNIAYHSRYIQKAGPEFLKLLKEIINTPFKRSDKWITTSLPEEDGEVVREELSSAEYHTNNLISPVYFEEAARKIPSNAVVVEVAPHGLMQAIVRKSHPNCTHIPLTRRGHENPIQFLLEALGKIYQQGYELNVAALYPKVEYPVSTTTPPISDYVQWYHEQDWIVYYYDRKDKNESVIFVSRTMPVSLQDDDHKFLAGHVREGKTVFPEAAVLYYVWNTLAMYKGVDRHKLSVTFRNVQFHNDVVIGKNETLQLKFEIFKGNQHFEVTRDDIAIAHGFIEIGANKSYAGSTGNVSEKFEFTSEDNKNIKLKSDDIYKILRLKGYQYKDAFNLVEEFSPNSEDSLIEITDNWIAFLDSLIQLNILARNHEGVSVPKLITEVTINTKIHFNEIEDKIASGQRFLNAQHFKSSGITQCAGVTVHNIVFDDKPVEVPAPDCLKDLNYYNEIKKAVPEYNVDDDCNHDYKLINTKLGDIESLKWVEVESKKYLNNVVKVCFAAPSMKDAYNAVGLVTKNNNFGMDFSGIDTKGNRVMGLVNGGALSSTVVPDSDLLWPVPKHWTLQEAATVPLPYVHALYCLILRGHLKRGYKVFVTGGAGALGQAVISICLSLKCKVFTHVADIEKKRFLMKLYPGLNASDIGVADDIEFFNVGATETFNNRCHLVINTTAGHLREYAMKIVVENGNFLDISDYDSMQNKPFCMQYLNICKSYVKVNMSSLFRPENVTERKLLQKLVSDGIANGMIKPISFVEYTAEEVGRAFRLLSQRKHRGRAIVNIGSVKGRNVIPRCTFSAEGVYMVVNEDDESDLGIKLTTYLIKSGAKRILFYQKRKEVSGFFQVQLETWKKLGGIVKVLSYDYESNNNIGRQFLERVEYINEILGIFVVHPKNYGLHGNLTNSVVSNVNEMSIDNCPNLKYFVIFSRNSENDKTDVSQLEKICDMRTKRGLPALMILTESLEDESDENSAYRAMSTETAIKSMEISLRKKITKALAYNEKSNVTEFSKALVKIMGIQNFDAIENLRVENLVLSEITVAEVQQAIKDNFNLSLSVADIKDMKILSLKNLDKVYKRTTNTRFDSKFDAFFNFFDYDIINATEIFIPMLTQISSAELIVNLHGKATNLIMLPGFEGHRYIYEFMAKSLKIRATTCQFGPDSRVESVQQIALDLMKRIKTRFILEPKFYLLGYSFGINIALEVAALLEKDGYVGVVYCLDSSPDALRAQLEAYLGPMTEAQLQNAIIKHVFYKICGQTCKTLEEDIERLECWPEKVASCVENLKHFNKISNDYKMNVIDTFYNRICLARSYDPDIKLESSIVLLKGIEHPKLRKLPADYGLSKYAKNPVKILHIDSDVASAPWDSRVPNFINQLLDPEYLEAYNKRNICNTYIIPRKLD